MTPHIDPAAVPARTLTTGQKMPVIGMGTFGSDKYTPAQVAAAVDGAIDFGWRMFDCASVYGNEALIGEVLHKKITDGIVRRDELFVTSKVWNDMHGEGDILLSLARSLKDLRLEYVDAFFIHWPFPNYHPPGCSADSRSPDARPYIHEEFMAVWRQMERTSRMGLVRALGVSNMTIPKLKLLLRDCEIKPAVIEMELHPTLQQAELVDYCLEHGLQIIGYSPIGSPSRPERDRTPEDMSDMDMPVIREIAEKHGVHPALVCLKWAAQRGWSPIPFAVQPEKYRANLACVLSDPLTGDEMAAIATCERGCRLVKGHVFLWPGAKDWRDLWDMDGSIVQ